MTYATELAQVNCQVGTSHTFAVIKESHDGALRFCYLVFGSRKVICFTSKIDFLDNKIPGRISMKIMPVVSFDSGILDFSAMRRQYEFSIASLW